MIVYWGKNMLLGINQKDYGILSKFINVKSQYTK